MRNPSIYVGRRRPEKKIVMEKFFAVRLLVRVENRFAIARPARRSDVVAVARSDDDELRLPFFVALHECELASVGRHCWIAAAARRLLPQLSFPQLPGTPRCHRALRQLRGESIVKTLRRIAEHTHKRFVETAPLTRCHAGP